MATPVFNTGYLGTFAFGATTGGTEFPTRSWRARNGTEADRAKNSLSGLYPIPLCTYASFITTVMFDVDFANPRFSTATYPIAIQQQLTDLNFYQSRSRAGASERSRRLPPQPFRAGRRATGLLWISTTGWKCAEVPCRCTR